MPLRAGIQAIHPGQREPLMIGMRERQVLRHYAILLLKDTSVASQISAPELMLRARDLSSEYFMPMQIYLVVGAIYLCMAYPLLYLVCACSGDTTHGQAAMEGPQHDRQG
jgi:ABC-type amino acid transport system permease subunit